MKEDFLRAIDNKLKVRITFDSKAKGRITRVCIPFDFGPSQKENAIDKSDKYHLWDLESPEGDSHNLSVAFDKIISLEVLNEGFDPGDFVSWEPKWIYQRDWGTLS